MYLPLENFSSSIFGHKVGEIRCKTTTQYHQLEMSWVTDFESQPRWLLLDNKLKPTDESIELYNDWLSSRVCNDHLISFSFSNPKTKPVTIHSSRLEFIGGPFSDITRCANSEERTKRTTLTGEDDSISFEIVRDFLYMKSIHLPTNDQSGNYDVQLIVKVICAAHHWRLKSLFLGFARFVTRNQILHTREDVLAAIQFAQLSGVSDDILLYFWKCVGEHYFDIIGPALNESKGKKESSQEVDNGQDSSREVLGKIAGSEAFPNLWSLAVSHGMGRSLLHTIIVKLSIDNDRKNRRPTAYEHLEWIVLGFLEPRISKDNEVMEVISQLRWPAEYWKDFLEDSTTISEYSNRALCLVARTLISSRIPRVEYRESWELNLCSITAPVEVCKNIEFPLSRIQLGNNGRGGLWRPMRGSFDKAILFTMVVHRDYSGIVLRISWGMPNFEITMVDYLSCTLSVCLIDDKCQCLERKPLDCTQPGNMLIEPTSTELESEYGYKEFVLKEKVHVQYLKSHGKNCGATLSVVVSK